MDVRRRWKEKLVSVNVDVYNIIKGYEAKNDCIETITMWYLGMVCELSRLGDGPYTYVRLVGEQS